jgi:hypothetical protein
MNRSKPDPLARLLALAPGVVGVGAMLLGLACDEKSAKSRAPLPDAGAGTDKYITADPKLEKALQAAATTAAAGNGPPADGIFPPGVADKRHPKGAPTTVETLSDGAEPRIALGGVSPDITRSTSYGPAAIELGMQMGPRIAMPTVDLGLTLGPAKKDEGGGDWLVADVRRASTAKEQFGELPPGTDRAIASLEGSQMRFKLGADGNESELEMQLSKQARPELERLAQSAAEQLVYDTVPTPSKPVGVGAQWIAETRMPLSGLDVIAYRAYRVKGIEGNRVSLTIDVKAYAASTDTHLQGVPAGATLQRVDATAQGALELVRGEVLARKSDVQQRVVFVFEAPGGAQPTPDPGEPPSQPGQPAGAKTLTAQMQSLATFVRGEDLRAALRP